MSNHYETLGVGVDASPEVIQRVYRQLAKAYHPDTNPDNPVGVEKLKQLSEAYETLKDPVKRLKYDRALGLGAAAASRARAPEQERAPRRDDGQAARRRTEEERRAREEAERRREAEELRAAEERRRRAADALRAEEERLRRAAEARRAERERRRKAADERLAEKEHRRRAAEESSAEKERRRQAAEARRARPEQRRRDDARPPGAASGPTRMQAARERLRARKTALAHAIAGLAGEELEDRVATRVGFSRNGGWVEGVRCSIGGPGADALSLGPSDEILQVILTGTSRRAARDGGEGRPDASLVRLLRAHERYLSVAGPARDPDLLRPAGTRWLAEAGAAFRAAVWAAVCTAQVRAAEADLVRAVRDEERQQRRARARHPIRRWLRPPAAAGAAQGPGPAGADLERQVRMLRGEYAVQLGLLQAAGDPLLDGFFEQCLLLTHAAAECVAPYLSAPDGALGRLIEERVTTMAEAARSGGAARGTRSP